MATKTTTDRSAAARKAAATRKRNAEAKRKAAEKSSTPKPKSTPKVDPNPEIETSTKKSLDSMTEAHRRHVERWEPLVVRLGIDHVWASTPRTPGRGEGSHYLILKNEAKSYSIVSLDTSDEKATPEVLDGPYTSPKAALEAFKAYRAKAKTERDSLRSASKPKAETSKPAPKPRARRPRKPAAK